MHLELTLNHNLLAEDVVETLNSLNINKINLTDKRGLPNNLLLAQEMKTLNSNLEICLHYSLKNHTSRNKNEIIQNFRAFFEYLTQTGVTEVLLISGSPKPGFEVLEALKLINEYNLESDFLKNTKISVAFNPFDKANLENEINRLKIKLSYSFVNKVYLQIGVLKKELQEGIKLVREINNAVEVIPSILLPSDLVLKKLGNKPIRGIYLDSKYLSNLKNANERTLEIIHTCKENSTSPMISVMKFGDLINSDIFKHYLQIA